MCGIAGFTGRHPLAPARIAAALPAMRHRGPDRQQARDFQHDGRTVHLLHARLSIIDLEARADQPLCWGGKWIAFNGEIYNYKEIRERLVAEGHRFTTESDTEVLLHALAAWGWDALDACEGMWAFALYDEASGELTLCRDRFGEKPLFVWRRPEGLYFGSEAKALAALAGTWPDIDRTHLKRYLVNGYKALFKTPATFFQGLEEVPPGCRLTIKADGSEDLRRYWTPSYAVQEEMSFAEAVAGTRERLIQSVGLRLRADVPIAFCMSGGIDSTALIAIAKRLYGFDVHGFTVVNTDSRYEEDEMVALMIRSLDLRHTPIPLDATDFLGRLRGLVRQHDAPVATISYYVHWLLMRQVAAHGYKVSISGTAADELFTGYYDHHLLWLAEVRGLAEVHAAGLAGWREQVAPIVRNPFLSDPERFVRDPEFRGHIFLGAEDFAARLCDGWIEPFAEQRFRPELLRNRMLNELFHEVVPPILREDDANAMSFSIENRSPFLDRALFDHAQSIPTRHLIGNGRAKRVLREAMRGIVPDPILDNPRKVGFNAPLEALLPLDHPAVREEFAADSPVYQVVRRDWLEPWISGGRTLPNSESKFLFNVLCAKMFLEQFTGGEFGR